MLKLNYHLINNPTSLSMLGNDNPQLLQQGHAVHRSLRDSFVPFATVEGYVQHMHKVIAEGAVLVLVTHASQSVANATIDTKQTNTQPTNTQPTNTQPTSAADTTTSTEQSIIDPIDIKMGCSDTATHTTDTVVAVLLYRIHHNTYQNQLFFLEDLVVADTLRSQGVGEQVLTWCEQQAQRTGCAVISLDSAVHRRRAHKFYFTQGYHIHCFHFIKALTN